MKIIEERIPWFYTPSFQPNGWITKQFPPPTKWPNKNYPRNGRKIRRMGKHLRDFPPGFCRCCLCSHFGCFFGHTLCGYTWHFFPSKQSSPHKTYEYKKTQTIQIFQIFFHPLHQEFWNLQSMGIQCERSDSQTSWKNLSEIKLFHKKTLPHPTSPQKDTSRQKKETQLTCRTKGMKKRTLIWV